MNKPDELSFDMNLYRFFFFFWFVCFVCFVFNPLTIVRAPL
jgi:hypothetical protein